MPLADRFPSLPPQGIGAELIAARWKFGRQALDEFSATSHQRAAAAAARGAFDREIVPVALPDGRLHTADETVRSNTTVEGLAALKPRSTARRWRPATPRSRGTSPRATPRR